MEVFSWRNKRWTSRLFLDVCQELSENIDNDLNRGIVAILV